MIRSLTIGLPLDVLSTTEIERAVKEVLGVASMELDRNSLSPRTVRFTLPPVGQDGETDGALLSRLRWVDELAASEGVRWFCCPVDLVAFGSSKVRLPAILDGLLRFDRMFANLILAQDGRIAVNALYEAAKLVLNLSLKSNNGFDNFRLGASFNCPANAPFFPFSRHDGDMVSFSFALETTQLAHQTLDAMGERPEPALARDRLVEALVPPLKRVDELGRSIARVTGTEYKGLDASLAPMPVDDVSVAGLVERLTGVSVG